MNEDEEREVEVLHPYNERAWVAGTHPSPSQTWRTEPDRVKLRWTRVADAVLDEYDEEYQSRKAGW